jgi:addiction module RelE/StbE family toxin
MKMELRWTKEAAADLENIANYLSQKTPERAAELVRGVYNAPAALLTFPYRGREGRKEGTRELVLSPLPYILIYQVRGEPVHVVRILHGAQKWP